MSKGRRNPKLDPYFHKLKQWKEEFGLLREIALDCGLTEDFKWMHPCYTFENKNIVLIHGFKNYCALLFHKGALLKIPTGSLSSRRKMFSWPFRFGSPAFNKSMKCGRS